MPEPYHESCLGALDPKTGRCDFCDCYINKGSCKTGHSFVSGFCTRCGQYSHHVKVIMQLSGEEPLDLE